MTAVTLETIIGAVTILLSVIGSSFATGSRLGGLEATLRSIGERLTRIEALFEFRLKGHDGK